MFKCQSTLERNFPLPTSTLTGRNCVYMSQYKSNLDLPPDDEADAGHAEEDDDEDRAHHHPDGDALAAAACPGRVGNGVELGRTVERIVD